MATLRELIIKISANSQSFQSEISRASRMGTEYYRTMQSGGRQAAAAARESQRAFSAVTTQLAETKNMAMGLAGTLAGSFALMNVVDAADSWGQMAARMKMAITSVEGDAGKYAEVQDRLLAVSNRNAKAIEDSQELYIASAKSMQELGYNTASTLDFIESLSSSLTRNATSAQKTESAISAINKAMVQGKFSGENWNTVASAMPSVIGDIASALGVTELEVKKMAADGKISMQLFADAVIRAKDANNAMADGMGNTVRDGVTKLTNSLKAYIGELNSAHGTTSVVAEALGGMAENVDLLAKGAGILVSVGVARAVGGWGSSLAESSKKLVSSTRDQLAHTAAQREGLITSLAQIQAEKESAIAAQRSLVAQMQLAQTEKTRMAIRQQMAVQTAEIVRLAQAEAAATTQLAAVQSRLSIAGGLAGKAMGLIGGPAGAAMLAGGALYYFYEQAQQAKQAAIDLSDTIPKLNEDLKGLSFAGLTAVKFKNEDDISNSILQINKLKKEILDYNTRIESLSSFDPFNQLKGVMSARAQAAADLEKATNGLTLAQERQASVIEALNTIKGKSATVTAQLAVANRDVTTELKDFEKSASSLALQLDVSQLSASGAAREAYVLAGLQKVAGDAALKHKDDLLALAKGQVMSGAISEELAAKLTDYAAKLGKLFDDNQSAKSFGKAANDTAKTYQRQIDTLNQQIALFGQTTELAKQRYQLTHGELQNLDSAKKAALEQRAAELDRLNAMKAYQDTMADLQTSEERMVTTTKERLKTIREAKLSMDELAAATEKASKASIIEAPKFGGLDASVGGASGELIRVAEAEGELQKWHDKQLDMQKQLLAEKEINEQTYADRVAEINQQNSERLEKIQSSYRTATLSMFSSLTGDAAALMEAMGQKGSAVYKAMFLASKAASIAQAIINTEEAATKAMAQGGMFMGVPMASVIRGVGYTSVALMASTTLAGMAHDGIDNVPREGTWLLDRGERVVDARTNADLKDFLSSGDTPDGLMGSSSQIVIHQTINVQGSGDAALKAAMQEAAEQGARKGAALSRQEMLNDFQTRGQGRKLLGV